MATHKILILPTLCSTIFTIGVASSLIYPLACSNNKIQTCNAYLYHISEGLTKHQIAAYYSVNASQIRSINRNTKSDYLVSVPCSCQDVNGTTAYFYDASYTVQEGDTFTNVATKIYSGQVWKVGEGYLVAGQVIPLHLACGCVEGRDSRVVVTYTVQKYDTLPGIATLLSSTSEGMEKLNRNLAKNPSYIDVGWVFFVPLEKTDTQTPSM